MSVFGLNNESKKMKHLTRSQIHNQVCLHPYKRLGCKIAKRINNKLYECNHPHYKANYFLWDGIFIKILHVK